MKSDLLATIFLPILALSEKKYSIQRKQSAKSIDVKQMTEIKTMVNPTSMLVTFNEDSKDKNTQNSKNVIDKTIQNNNKELLKTKKVQTKILLTHGYKCLDTSEQDPILKILVKYKGHPSIKLIKAKNSSQVFKFSQIDIEEVKNFFQSLHPKKSARKDIKTNLLKKNVDFLAKYTFDDIDYSIRFLKYSYELKQADIVSTHKTSQNFQRKIIDLSVSSQMFLRFTKGAYTIK